MRICGLQKLTALDFPDRLACIVFLGGCNLRCPFCHNASLALSKEAEIDREEFFSLLLKRKGILEGVCVTGGEPLLNPDIADFLSEIKSYGYLVKLDTNGAFPERLSELIDKKLVDYVAMDIKNSPEKYPVTCGFSGRGYGEFYAPFKRSVEILLKGNVDYEFRTTVTEELHTVEDIEKIANEINGAKRWYLQQFVDSGEILCSGLSAPSEEKLVKMQQKACDLGLKCQIRGM